MIDRSNVRDKGTRVLLIIGCFLFFCQNLLFYILTYYLSLDVLGAILFSIALTQISFQEKNRIYFMGGISMLLWGVGTSFWRYLVYQEPDVLSFNLYGYYHIVILFGISAFLLFIGLFIFLKIAISSQRFSLLYKIKKRFPRMYIRGYLLYILLHLSASVGILIGAYSTTFLILLELSFFFKLFIVPAFGLFSFGGMIYILMASTENSRFDLE